MAEYENRAKMSLARPGKLYPQAVAQIFYRTNSPDEDQIENISLWMRTGVIPSRNGTTTESELANFMANSKQQQLKKKQGRDRESKIAGKSPSDLGELEFSDIYRDFWKDYFLAMLLRRRSASQTTAFRYAVLGGQVALLLTLGFGFWWCISSFAGL
jgi:hypothetical protein